MTIIVIDWFDFWNEVKSIRLTKRPKNVVDAGEVFHQLAFLHTHWHLFWIQGGSNTKLGLQNVEGKSVVEHRALWGEVVQGHQLWPGGDGDELESTNLSKVIYSLFSFKQWKNLLLFI